MIRLLFLIIFLMLVRYGSSQETLPPALQNAIEAPRYFRVMFYNCENFFDVINDSIKNDDEFTTEGDRRWNLNRYYEKQSNLCKVICGIGGWTPPELIGLCEIENRKVITDLVYNSNLYRFEYKFIHKESPDPRGIDVALLYQPKFFKPIKTEFMVVKFPGEEKYRTRDILYTTGITNKNDTLHIFVNHWPSRWGGLMETEENRIYVASLLKRKTDSIFVQQPNASIIILGDLNDYPDNRSITQTLQAKHDFNEIDSHSLYDLGYVLQFEKETGSHKYEGQWGVLDHIIVSGDLLKKSSKMYCSKEDIFVFNPPFLLENDETYLGQKPFRTYSGFKYLGGFGDHLPVFLNFYHNED